MKMVDNISFVTLKTLYVDELFCFSIMKGLAFRFLGLPASVRGKGNKRGPESIC